MKLSKFKKIIISSSFIAAGVGIVAGVAPTLINNSHTTSHTSTSNNNSNVIDSSSSSNVTSTSDNTNTTSTSNNSSSTSTIVTSSENYSFSLQRAESSSASTDPKTAEYTIKIEKNDSKEGKVHFVKSDGTTTDTMTFKPGEKITVVMNLNKGYETYTVRDLNVRGSSQNVWIPSQNDPSNVNQFIIQMPKYEDTLDPETGKSSIYEVGTPFTITPTFIQESIGTDDNKVDWQHGAYADSLNGYVYDMSKDITWSSLKNNLYETFENKEITNPIDVYIYLHGHDLTFDQTTIDLGIKSGWAIHIYNNKTDSKETATTKNSSDGYGEIIVPTDSQAKVDVKGSITLGGSVKYKFIPSTDGIIFISYNDTKWVGYQSNDPVQRLGK